MPPSKAARIRLPIPRDWLKEADAPRVRVVCAWNTPVNAAAPDIWACRKVTLQLRPSLNANAPRARGNATGAYPLIDRTYDLSADMLEKLDGGLHSNQWVLEVAYEDVAPYPPLMRVDEQQRVSVALELFDEGETRLSPQVAVQSMPMADTMIHLGGVKQAIWSPIKVPT